MGAFVFVFVFLLLRFPVFCVLLVFWSLFYRGRVVRHGVCASVRIEAFTVAILAQGTNRGDALCAALLLNRVGTILAWRKRFVHRVSFLFEQAEGAVVFVVRSQVVYRAELSP